jgi:2-amino-4-hydroxy-6-hydroxymethyldihydropteridine diphosphokinase
LKNLVFLGLGGNEGDVLARLQLAITMLAAHPTISAFRCSSFYQSAPFEMKSENWFVNSVCMFQTTLSPSELFNFTQQVETKLGKIPKPKNCSRPIDIDFLFYGHDSCQYGELQVPHARWKERLFVLMPLMELTEKIVIEEESILKEYSLKDMVKLLLERYPSTIYKINGSVT